MISSLGPVQAIPPGTADWYIQNFIYETDDMIQHAGEYTQAGLESKLGFLIADLDNISGLLPGKASDLLELLEDFKGRVDQGLSLDPRSILDWSSKMINSAVNLTSNPTIQLEEIRAGVCDLTQEASDLYEKGELSSDDCEEVLDEAAATANSFYSDPVEGESKEVELALDQFENDEQKFRNLTGSLTPAEVNQLLKDLQLVSQELPEPPQG